MAVWCSRASFSSRLRVFRSGERRFYPFAKFVPYRKSCTRTHSREIPTASDVPPRHTSRGFLHWRLSDDGPGASRIVPIGAQQSFPRNP